MTAAEQAVFTSMAEAPWEVREEYNQYLTEMEKRYGE